MPNIISAQPVGLTKIGRQISILKINLVDLTGFSFIRITLTVLKLTQLTILI